MSTNIGGIRFCKECNNMMKPVEGNWAKLDEKKLTFVCRCCEFRETVDEFETPDDYLISRKELKSQKTSMFVWIRCFERPWICPWP
jgi:DNA-directed RNA polymerase subunit M/transcription elongation factor TFIIS